MESWRCWMLNIKKSLFSLTLMICISAISFGQEVLTLDSVLSKIQQHNPELKMYDQQINSQNALVSGASAWMAPMVGVSTFMTPYNNFSQPRNQQDGSFMLTAEQKIPSKAKIKAFENYLNTQSAITSEAKAENFNELRAMARSTYFDVLIAQKQLNYFLKNLQILQNLKKLAEIRYAYNKASLSQIFMMEARIFELQNKLSDTEANIQIGKIKLNTLMNRPKNIDFKLDSLKDYRLNELNKNVSDIVENRSNVKQVDAQIKSLALENKMIASEAKPEFSIQFDHMITYNNTMPNQFSLMGGVSIPIAPWAAKSYKSKLKANQFDVAAMQLQKESLMNNLTGMIKSQEEKLANIQHQLQLFEGKLIPALQKSYDVVLLNYQENKEELPMVLDSWKEINNSQLEYLMLLNNYYQTLAEYEKNVER
ncbi:TolC family protein [Pedobacter cryophilus]|nr:TolC family protein [Pedobacter cryophilus]